MNGKEEFFFKENDEKIFQKIYTHKKFQIDNFFKKEFFKLQTSWNLSGVKKFPFDKENNKFHKSHFTPLNNISNFYFSVFLLKQEHSEREPFLGTLKIITSINYMYSPKYFPLWEINQQMILLRKYLYFI